MAKKSSLNPEDAQEMLASLGQMGEGWWRQVGLAVRMNAPKALDMDRREFVQAVGVRMGLATVERDNAIRELAEEGMPKRAIADVLGISHHTVADVLAGRDPAQRIKNAARGRASVPDTAAAGPDPKQLESEKKKLERQLEDAAKKAGNEEAQRKLAEARIGAIEADLAKTVKDQKKIVREAVKEAVKQAAKTDEDRKREEREAKEEEAKDAALNDALGAPFKRLEAEAKVAAVEALAEELGIALDELDGLLEDLTADDLQRIGSAIDDINQAATKVVA